jgi:hypothetical protein
MAESRFGGAEQPECARKVPPPAIGNGYCWGKPIEKANSFAALINDDSA